MKKIAQHDFDKIGGGLFPGDAGNAIVYQINGPIAPQNGSNATVNYNANGGVASVQINCPPGTVPSITNGSGTLDLGAGAIGKIVNGSGSVGGNGASITCVDKR